MMKTRCAYTLAIAAGAALGASAPVLAQYSSTFEAPTYTGSASGTVISGQDGWYLPSVGGADHNVFTYVGNTRGIPANPNGGAQFDVGHSTGVYGRAQHDINFSAGGAWSAEFDYLARWDGTLPAVDNQGSWSLQDSSIAAYFQCLMTWGTHTAAADAYNIQLGAFSTAAPTTLVFNDLGTAFDGIPVNHWVHVKFWWDFNGFVIKGARIQDITAGTPAFTIDVSALDYHLYGGPTSTSPLPTATRFFAGGTTDGNTNAFDNYVVHQETFAAPLGACCLAAGGCSQLTSGACAAGGGVYRGDSVACANANCPQFGACCLADGTCSVVTSTNCAGRTGVYRGDNTTCTGACPQPYTEVGDAGETPATAAVVPSTGGTLPGIIGSFASTDDTDMYAIQICDHANFKATGQTWYSMDTVLFLFNANGIGVENNDEGVGQNGGSGELQAGPVPSNGLYYLAVAGYLREPLGATTSGAIWATYGTGGATPAPDGPAATEPVGSWITTVATTVSGSYTIALQGACYFGVACYPNCDRSTTAPCLNVADFTCFLNSFANGASYANCDNSTTPPVLNVADFTCFLNRFATGCGTNC